MARTYAKSYVSMWDAESDFLSLTADAQWLYQALYSHPLLSPAGVLPHQPRKWARKARDMTPKRIAAAVDLLTVERYLLLDEDTEECMVRTFIRHDQGWRTPNIRKSIETSISRIESEALRVSATLELTHALRVAGLLPDGSPDGSGHAKGQGSGKGIGHRTPPPPQTSPEDSHPSTPTSSFQSSSTSTVGTRRGGSQDDQRSGRGGEGSIIRPGAADYLKVVGGRT
jgi:hypothetical protein